MNNDAKKRIDSIKSTKKIISVMKQASVAKLKNIKNSIVSSEHFLDDLRLIAKQLLLTEEISKQVRLSPFFSPITKKNSSLPRILLFITSDKGLCGSYNSFAKSSFDKTFKQNDKIICIGKKGYDHIMRNYKSAEIVMHSCFSEEKSYNPDLEISSNIASILMDFFLKFKSSCLSLSSHCVGGAAINGMVENILPFSIENLEKFNAKERSLNIETNSLLLTQPTSDIVNNFVKVYMEFFVYNKLLDAMFAEESARAIAMESASKNSDDALIRLQIDFNRQRQAKITQEISEVINSSEFV